VRKLIIVLSIGLGVLLASRGFPLEAHIFDGADINPSLYAMRGVSRVDFISARASAGNNAFSLGDYSLYNGDFLTDADKAKIMESVPESGVDTRAYASLGTAAVMRGGLYVAAAGRAGQNSSMPRDVLDLALYGNEIGRTYCMDGASGEALALADITLGYSRPIDFSGREFFAGARLHILKGLAYGGVVRAGGSLHTEVESLSGDGEIVTRTAKGGTGYSLDIGACHRTYSHIVISAYILNALSLIRWTSGCREDVNTLIAENVTFGAASADSLLEDFHDSRDLSGFSTSLAPVLGIGVEKDLRWAYLSVLYTQGIRQGAFATGRPRLSVAGIWESLGFMDLGAGLAYEAGFGIDECVRMGFGRSPRLEVGAGFSPLPHGSSLKQLEVSMRLSHRL
jgi:hypothetical protein